LLNIGPRADGSIPEESVRILTKVGEWMDKNGSTIYGADRCSVRRANYLNFSRKGNTLYVHSHFWPGEVLTIGGLLTDVKSVRLLASGKKVEFTQGPPPCSLHGTAREGPDDPVTTLVVECASEPKQDNIMVRKEHPRGEA